MLNIKIKSFEQVCSLTRDYQKDGKKVVLCHGFFDILHKGHTLLLNGAKEHADLLIVGIDHDDNAKILKGHRRPVNDHFARMEVVASLESVDLVFLIKSIKNEENMQSFYTRKYYKELMPDMIASCLKSGKYDSIKKQQAESLHIQYLNIDSIYDKNTTRLIKIFGLE